MKGNHEQTLDSIAELDIGKQTQKKKKTTKKKKKKHPDINTSSKLTKTHNEDEAVRETKEDNKQQTALGCNVTESRECLDELKKTERSSKNSENISCNCNGVGFPCNGKSLSKRDGFTFSTKAEVHMSNDDLADGHCEDAESSNGRHGTDTECRAQCQVGKVNGFNSGCENTREIPNLENSSKTSEPQDSEHNESDVRLKGNGNFANESLASGNNEESAIPEANNIPENGRELDGVNGNSTEQIKGGNNSNGTEQSMGGNNGNITEDVTGDITGEVAGASKTLTESTNAASVSNASAEERRIITNCSGDIEQEIDENICHADGHNTSEPNTSQGNEKIVDSDTAREGEGNGGEDIGNMDTGGNCKILERNSKIEDNTNSLQDGRDAASNNLQQTLSNEDIQLLKASTTANPSHEKSNKSKRTNCEDTDTTSCKLEITANSIGDPVVKIISDNSCGVDCNDVAINDINCDDAEIKENNCCDVDCNNVETNDVEIRDDNCIDVEIRDDDCIDVEIRDDDCNKVDINDDNCINVEIRDDDCIDVEIRDDDCIDVEIRDDDCIDVEIRDDDCIDVEIRDDDCSMIEYDCGENTENNVNTTRETILPSEQNTEELLTSQETATGGDQDSKTDSSGRKNGTKSNVKSIILRPIIHSCVTNKKGVRKCRRRSSVEIKTVTFSQDTIFNEDKSKQYRKEKISFKTVYKSCSFDSGNFAKINPLFEDDSECGNTAGSCTSGERRNSLVYLGDDENSMSGDSENGSGMEISVMNFPSYMEKYLQNDDIPMVITKAKVREISTESNITMLTNIASKGIVLDSDIVPCNREEFLVNMPPLDISAYRIYVKKRKKQEKYHFIMKIAFIILFLLIIVTIVMIILYFEVIKR
ncbi:uncharacterized protein LOC115215478 [Argonauta hians]